MNHILIETIIEITIKYTFPENTLPFFSLGLLMTACPLSLFILGIISGCISEDFVSLLVLHFNVSEDIILFFTSGLDFLGDGVDLMFFGLGGTAGLFGLDKELADL